MPDSTLVLEVCGEGKTDIGQTAPPGKTRPVPEPPTQGVLPVLVHKLCGKPASMKVVRRAVPYLVGKSVAQKVKFVKRTAVCNQSAGAVFVVDTEGEHPDKKRAELAKGRDSAYFDFPMAVRVAHPCIEAWLLAIHSAVAQALNLNTAPAPISSPEDLPAPCKDRANNPKSILGALVGRSAISSSEATRIVTAMSDMTLLRQLCPLSFEPFATEVEQRIAPLFH
jgi:hypothetical protein